MAVKQGPFRLSAASARGIEDGFVRLGWSRTGAERCFAAAGLRSAFRG